jgi:hypothetical protein
MKDGCAGVHWCVQRTTCQRHRDERMGGHNRDGDATTPEASERTRRAAGKGKTHDVDENESSAPPSG